MTDSEKIAILKVDVEKIVDIPPAFGKMLYRGTLTFVGRFTRFTRVSKLHEKREDINIYLINYVNAPASAVLHHFEGTDRVEILVKEYHLKGTLFTLGELLSVCNRATYNFDIVEQKRLAEEERERQEKEKQVGEQE